MNIERALRELYDEKKRLDEVIDLLERRLVGNSSRPEGRQPGRRGRRHMSQEERLQVSQRMQKYWADRKGNAGGSPGVPPADQE